MGDFLDVLARDAVKTIAEGYYEVDSGVPYPTTSLKKGITSCKVNPVIAEIKTMSPSRGVIRTGVDPVEIAMVMESCGATGISILTEPRHFSGNFQTLRRVRDSVKVPILMKDIVLDPQQVEGASKMGADAVLLIKALFDRGHSCCGLRDMIEHAHRLGLEVLLETHTGDEFQSAVQSEADLIGINNRDMGTLDVDLGVTERILREKNAQGRTVVTESGITTPHDLRFLRDRGAQAFLIGSAIMRSDDIGEAVRRFVTA